MPTPSAKSSAFDWSRLTPTPHRLPPYERSGDCSLSLLNRHRDFRFGCSGLRSLRVTGIAFPDGLKSGMRAFTWRMPEIWFPAEPAYSTSAS